ncbi:MAG: Mur ligase family protein [Bacteroidales bacterium]|jgi:UDP-N-acetylmuramate: L-alanyl-gamma-D-glutamyl-meso-diaminopimelate ligase
MKLHFIAIGGAAMHNLAIALKEKGYNISGSDDEIFEPSRSRLKRHGLLPEKAGWHPEKITGGLDGVILGMHARNDNPELSKAEDLGLKLYSFPEYLYEQTRNKTRVVIAGSHGKTTITAMVIHVLTHCGRKFDFMVGSQIEGFETMVSLNDNTDLAIFEGDEYLSSPLDPTPKFIHYKPHIALASGIAWDHINVFPTFEEYVNQFRILTTIIEKNGHFVCYSGDELLRELAESCRKDISVHPYSTHASVKKQGKFCLTRKGHRDTEIGLFGDHNLQNISGAKCICGILGIGEEEFYTGISTFGGTRKRLQVIRKTKDSTVFMDFAHSPSKVRATVQAVRESYPHKKMIAVLELHTFSSLTSKYIPEYKGTLDAAEEVLKQKNLEKFTEEFIRESFRNDDLIVYSDTKKLAGYISQIHFNNVVLLFMSSGNYGNIGVEQLTRGL